MAKGQLKTQIYLRKKKTVKEGDAGKTKRKKNKCEKKSWFAISLIIEYLFVGSFFYVLHIECK